MTAPTKSSWFPKLVAVGAAVLALAPAAALADPVVVRVGGHMHARGGVEYGRHHGGGRVIVTGGVYATGYGEYYGGNCCFAEPPPPPPPPSCEYPQAPPAYYYNSGYQQPAPPVPVVYAEAPAAERHWGIGLYASSVQLKGGDTPANGAGADLRFRLAPSTELELELGQDQYQTGRVDSHLGGTLYLNLSTGTFVPYLLVGGGVNGVHRDGITQDEAQGYLQGGGGLGLRLGDRFLVAADLRWSARYRAQTMNDGTSAQPVARATTGTTTTVDPSLADKEGAAEARVLGILYF